MAIFGYCRVSTDGQSLAAQHSQLHTAGCSQVFAEKISGAVTNRPELTKALAALQDGDIFVVTRLDRLARSTRDLLNILDTISKAGAGFRSLADTWADTTTPHGRMMLTVLGGISEFERTLIMARTGDGRARAKARGVKFGRPRRLSDEQRSAVLERLRAGETKRAIAASYNMHPTSISRVVA